MEKTVRFIEAPSTREASMSSSGSAWEMSWRMKKTPKAVTAPGRMTESRLLTRPRRLMTTYSGMMLSVGGIVSVATVMPNTAFRPRNRALAKAKPASVQKKIVVAVTARETTSDRPSAATRSTCSSASRMFSKSCGPGSRGGVPS